MFKLLKNSYCFSKIKELNYYEILEIKKNCTKQDIKQNYLRLAKIYHPDVYKGNDKERFKLIQEAYNTLKSADKRKKYDSDKFGTKNEPQDFTQADDNIQEDKTEQKTSQKNTNEFGFKDYESAKKLNPEEVQEEYEQFMRKPMKTDPAEILTYENIFMRQQTKNYKEQSKYVWVRENTWLYTLTHGHRMGFHEQVKMYIDSMNSFFQKKKEETPEKIKEEVRKYKKKISIYMIIVAAIIIPIIHSGIVRRQKITNWIKEDTKKVEEMEEQVKILETQQRLIY